MKTPGRQTKDIPDRPVLEFLRDLGRWATWFDYDPRPNNTVVSAMPEGTPPKMALSKMNSLIRRGLVSGCPCGCRGDFEITPAGRQFLEGLN